MSRYIELGGAPRGISSIGANDSLFWKLDPVVKSWNPSKDALKVAGLIVNKGSLFAKELQELIKWPVRRLNPAISFLVEHGYVLASKTSNSKFVSSWLSCTPKTRMFLRNKS